MTIFTYKVSVHDKKTLDKMDGRWLNERISTVLSSYKDFIKFENNIAYFKQYHGNFNIFIDGMLVLKVDFKSSYEYTEGKEETIKNLIDIATEKLQERDFESTITLIDALKKLTSN